MRPCGDDDGLMVVDIRNCHTVDQWDIQDHPVMPLWLDHSSGINSSSLFVLMAKRNTHS
jgi:hypothetical protein